MLVLLIIFMNLGRVAYTQQESYTPEMTCDQYHLLDTGCGQNKLHTLLINVYILFARQYKTQT